MIKPFAEDVHKVCQIKFKKQLHGRDASFADTGSGARVTPEVRLLEGELEPLNCTICFITNLWPTSPMAVDCFQGGAGGTAG